MELKKLADKFDEADLEWRIGSCGITSGGKAWATILCYVTNRAIMNRLDDICGPHLWKNEFREWPNGQLCGISIKVDGEWVTKWDGAQCTQIEPLKGGLSDSMKRAAVQWGIGRYLYELPNTLATCHTDKPRQSDGWRRATTKDNKVFWWKNPELALIAPWAIPTQRKVEMAPPLTKDELAELALSIESAPDWPALRLLAGQVLATHKDGRFDPPARAMELAKSAAATGQTIIGKADIKAYRAMVDHYIRANLLSSEEGLTYQSLAASRLEVPQ